MSRVDVAHQVNTVIKQQRTTINDTLPRMINEGIVLASGNAANARAMVATIGESVNLLTPRPWVHNMYTEPGDLVYDPSGNNIYIYSNPTGMTHANQLFYPGASGVYYWSIVPKTKDGIKIYPNIPGIVVSVDQGELWWNQSMTAVYSWKGADNDSCSWPPVDGNEWIRR